jgi:hypothetical protein
MLHRSYKLSLISFCLILFTLTDVSMTGRCCQDEDDQAASRLTHTLDLTKPCIPHVPHSAERCFCCSTLLTPHDTVQIEEPQIQHTSFAFAQTLGSSVYQISVYHPPKSI